MRLILLVDLKRKKILDHWLSEFEIADKISITQVEKLKPNTKIYEITLIKRGNLFRCHL